MTQTHPGSFTYIIPLPTSLTRMLKSTCRGSQPLARVQTCIRTWTRAIDKLVRVLISALNSNLSEDVNATTEQDSKENNITLIVTGASNLRRCITLFVDLDIVIDHTPTGWVISAANMESLLSVIRETSIRRMQKLFLTFSATTQ
jgi:hypothetical protein